MRRMTPLLVAALLLIGLSAAGLGWPARPPPWKSARKRPISPCRAPADKPVKLSELTAKGPVVVFTFIQAFTNT